MALGIENLSVAVEKGSALDQEIVEVLQSGGISTLEQLGRTSAGQLEELGIGKDEAGQIITAMKAFKIVAPSFKVEDFKS
jgi:mevalonate kinase